MRRGVTPRDGAEPVHWDALVDVCAAGDFRSVHVVAAGPSAKHFIATDDALAVTCNDAWALCRDLPFVYALADTYMVRRYLAFGLPTPPIATVFWAGENGPPETTETARAFGSYVGRWRRPWPEVFAFRPAPDGLVPEDTAVAVDNATRLTDDFSVGLSIGPRLMNSGMLALHVGWILARRLGGLPLHVHGLDLGAGPREYFDGRRLDRRQDDIFGDRPRDRTTRILRAMARHPEVTLHNHSFFRPEVDVDGE
ncbi:MAG: hypothetical protein AAGE94_08220 [Acidobacteriota bacterium]